MASFNGLGLHLGNLSRLSDAESRSISAENPTGEKGKGAMALPDKGFSRLVATFWRAGRRGHATFPGNFPAVAP